MNKEPTKAQLKSQLDFGKVSTIAGRFCIPAEDLQQLRRIIRDSPLSAKEFHEVIDEMEEERLV